MQQRPTGLPILAISLNAMLWGLSWWPLHLLRDRGVHGLWTTFLSYTLAVALVLAWRPATLQQLAHDKRLWLLMATSGLTNASFNWAISIGDVVRVVLLLYLMPVWSVLLTWIISGERPRLFTLLRVTLALSGVVLVLQPPDSPWNQLTLPLPRSLPDGLALVSGFVFACSNVLLNRLGPLPATSKILAMFSGCMLLSGLLAVSMWQTGVGGVSALPPMGGWVMIVALVSLQLMLCNIFLQYGAPRMSANTLALLMSLEVLFATVSAAALSAGSLGGRVLVGGMLVVGAALLEAHHHLGRLRARRQTTQNGLA
jgi:drug/metabolite transporter (DMT)-like permease